MPRLIALLVAAFALAAGLDWLAARPGTITIDWLGYRAEPTVFQTVVGLALVVGFGIFAWNLLRQIWLSPAIIGGLFNRRRQKRGLEALSSGLIALGAGDKQQALRYAVQARQTLPNEPLTHLLRAQAARMAGDTATSRRIFEAMLSSPDTEQLGLRGLFLEAESEGESEAARQFAERALRVNPKLGWAVESLFDLQCKHKNWEGALETLSLARKHGHIDKPTADRRRAVLLAGQAQALEEADPNRALALAGEAHGLADELVPAAVIAGRILASKGSTPRATRIIQRTWRKAPHPDLALVYAYARIGDSPRDRLERVKQLAMLAPMSIESPIAVATAAIEAKDWDEARLALEPLAQGRLTQRICTLMARVEGEQHGDKGRVREWLARAVNAPRDPAWTADGVVSATWAPVSPVTGALDAFQWKVPVEHAEKRDADLLAEKLEELVALGAPIPGATSAEPKVIETRHSESGAAAGRPARPSPATVADAEVVEPEMLQVAGKDQGTRQTGEAAVATEARSAATGRARESSRSDGDGPTAAKMPPSAKAPAAASAEPPVVAAARAATAPAVANGEAGGSTAAVAGSVRPATSARRDVAAQGGRAGATGEPPRIFVAPRPPDDPGPDAEGQRRLPIV